MKVHDLKCWPASFRPLNDGSKNAEFRRNDRGFEVGDILLVREWEPIGGTDGTTIGRYTGQYAVRIVTHAVYGPAFEIPDGYALLSLDIPNDAVALDAMVTEFASA